MEKYFYRQTFVIKEKGRQTYIKTEVQLKILDQKERERERKKIQKKKERESANTKEERERERANTKGERERKLRSFAASQKDKNRESYTGRQIQIISRVM